MGAMIAPGSEKVCFDRGLPSLYGVHARRLQISFGSGAATQKPCILQIYEVI